MLFSSAVAAAEDRHAARVRREEQRRLAGRVAGADDVDVEAVRVRRLAARRAVEDALADEPVEALDRELPPRDAAGEDDRPRAQDVAAVEVHLARRGVDPRDRARDEDLGAEPPRLLQRAARELVARDAGREAEVVLDPRRGAGLAAGRLALDDDRAQPLGRAVDGRREPGRARRRRSRCRTPRPRGSVAEAEQLGDPAQLRPHDRLAVDDADRGQSSSAGSGPPHCSAASGASGVSQRNEIWLRSRKRRSSAQAASQRWPTTIARGGGGSAARPCRPARAADPVRGERADRLRRRPARRRRQRGSRAARSA